MSAAERELACLRVRARHARDWKQVVDVLELASQENGRFLLPGLADLPGPDDVAKLLEEIAEAARTLADCRQRRDQLVG